MRRLIGISTKLEQQSHKIHIVGAAGMAQNRDALGIHNVEVIDFRAVIEQELNQLPLERDGVWRFGGAEQRRLENVDSSAFGIGPVVQHELHRFEIAGGSSKAKSRSAFACI
jgi:hypothetical protein